MIRQTTTSDRHRQERLWSERMAADRELIADIVEFVLRNRIKVMPSPSLAPRDLETKRRDRG